MKIASLFAELSLKGGQQVMASIKGVASASIAAKAGIAAAVAALYSMTSAARELALYLDKYELSTAPITCIMLSMSLRQTTLSRRRYSS
jgi:hypothetical protein